MYHSTKTYTYTSILHRHYPDNDHFDHMDYTTNNLQNIRPFSNQQRIIRYLLTLYVSFKTVLFSSVVMIDYISIYLPFDLILSALTCIITNERLFSFPLWYLKPSSHTTKPLVFPPLHIYWSMREDYEDKMSIFWFSQWLMTQREENWDKKVNQIITTVKKKEFLFSYLFNHETKDR